MSVFAKGIRYCGQGAALAVAVAALAVAGCGGGSPESNTNVSFGVSRVIDHEARVVCWSSLGGIACLPCADVAPGVCDREGGR